MSAYELPTNLACDDGSLAVGAEATDAAAGAFSTSVRILSTDEVVFAAGEKREHLYKVEAGAVCVSRTMADGSREVIDLALPGDLVGFGSRPHHAWTAEAIGETKVRCLPISAETYFAALDAKARDRRDRAVARELEAVRDCLVARGRRNPLARFAALLIVLSRANASEGRDPTLIAERFSCGIVAGYLDMKIDELATHLVELAERGLVKTDGEHGLRLLDIPALDRLSDE